MGNWKKLAQGAAGAAGAGGSLNVEDVFSTYLYKGSGSTAQDITNNIDLSTEGGAVWIKARDQSYRHALYDTERGAGNFIVVDDTVAQQADGPSGLSAFNTDGFTLTNSHTETNSTNENYVSWAFRRAPKFFDIIEWTGDSNATKSLSHNLGVEPKFIMIREYSTGNHQITFEITSSTTAYNLGGFSFNGGFTSTSYSSGNRLSSKPTTTTLNVGGAANTSGSSYVAYLWANNDGDGEFGPTADQDIIKIGRYVSNGSTSGPVIDLGFEPQFVMVKSTVRSTDWLMWDTMRGFHAADGGNDQQLQANQTYSESGSDLIRIQSTGFQIWSGDEKVNEGNSEEYWYMAIRRGPMAVPESATDVFATETWGATSSAAPAWYSGWPVDAALNRSYATTANNSMIARLTDNKAYFTNSTSNGTFGSSNTLWDQQEGLWNQTGTVSTYVSHMWRRAPNFFDVVAYTGNGTAGRTVTHNLGVAPEMMWVKRRDSADNWLVYHSGLDVNGDGRPETDAIVLDTNGAAFDYNRWNDTAPTATEFTVHSDSVVNANGGNYIAFLFASLNGVSKVGTYTGSASDQNIDCGFSNGAKLVIIKAADNGTDWYLFSEGLGITTATDDPIIILNSSSSEDEEYTGYSGAVSPYSGGFKVIGDNNEVNRGDGRTYIFYAVA